MQCVLKKLFQKQTNFSKIRFRAGFQNRRHQLLRNTRVGESSQINELGISPKLNCGQTEIELAQKPASNPVESWTCSPGCPFKISPVFLFSTQDDLPFRRQIVPGRTDHVPNSSIASRPRSGTVRIERERERERVHTNLISDNVMLGQSKVMLLVFRFDIFVCPLKKMSLHVSNS